jgi:hypothetical protein
MAKLLLASGWMLRIATPSFSKKNFSENQKWKKRTVSWAGCEPSVVSVA